MKIAGLILAESLVFHPKFIKAFCLLNLSDLGDAVVSCAAVSSTLSLSHSYFIFCKQGNCELPSPPPPPPGLTLSKYLCKEHFIKLLGHFSLLSLSDAYGQPGILKDATVLESCLS